MHQRPDHQKLPDERLCPVPRISATAEIGGWLRFEIPEVIRGVDSVPQL